MHSLRTHTTTLVCTCLWLLTLSSCSYRKIAGDHCIGGDTTELDPTVVTCSNTDPTSQASGPSTMEVILAVVFTVLFLLLVFMIVMLSIMVVYMFK